MDRKHDSYGDYQRRQANSWQPGAGGWGRKETCHPKLAPEAEGGDKCVLLEAYDTLPGAGVGDAGGGSNRAGGGLRSLAPGSISLAPSARPHPSGPVLPYLPFEEEEEKKKKKNLFVQKRKKSFVSISSF